MKLSTPDQMFAKLVRGGMEKTPPAKLADIIATWSTADRAKADRYLAAVIAHRAEDQRKVR